MGCPGPQCLAGMQGGGNCQLEQRVVVGVVEGVAVAQQVAQEVAAGWVVVERVEVGMEVVG